MTMAMPQDRNPASRLDRVARSVGSRRTFVAALAALAAGLAKIRRAEAQGYCSAVGGFCNMGVPCCPGHACTYEYNRWVGRCGRITEEGGIGPIESPAQVWAARITDRASVRKARLERRRDDRRDRRRDRRRR
jgi:hypothetical protein